MRTSAFVVLVKEKLKFGSPDSIGNKSYHG